MDELPEKRPTHVAIIMDGNGRWARARNMPRTQGHMAGEKSVRTVVRCCIDWGIPYLTLYAFSTENWNRPAAEVRFLMSQLTKFLNRETEELVKNGIRLRAIGRIQELPAEARAALQRAETRTAGGEALLVNVAVNYGSRNEIIDAVRHLARRIEAGELASSQIDEQEFARALYTGDIPDPDLMIRTGGEHRLSNFLLWQASYAELFVTDLLWPDFGRQEFLELLRQYAIRERRFGRVQQADEATGSLQ